METLHDTIDQLSDEAALNTLGVVLRRAGLSPDPFAQEAPEEQLRQALTQPDLPSLDAVPVDHPTDGDIARATLHYLVVANFLSVQTDAFESMSIRGPVS